MLEKKEIKATAEEAKFIRNLNVCKSACQKLIEETVKHFEKNEITEFEFWDQITEKYKLDPEYEWKFNSRTKTIERGAKFTDHKINKYLNEHDFRKFVREAIKETLKAKK